MGCKYNNNQGACIYFDEDANYEINKKGLAVEYGLKEDGFCVVDEDPKADKNCDYDESEYGGEGEWRE